ncbi:Ger(x)C family spore germination protein [Ureibacillus thermosphaericus]|uniref:Ger(x)C family spore germination protein n=1 Tax=Ureibacillus thermosphaericus TaxID=51173 RepID=UPI0030C9B448
MKRFQLKFAFVLIAVFLLSGCWDRYELEERANILALSIDIAEEGEDIEMPEVTHSKGEFPAEEKIIYKVAAQLAVPGKIMLGPEGGDTNSAETDWLLVTYGYSMKDVLSNLQQELAEKIYLGHIQLIVVSDKIAKKGLEDIMDFLKRDFEVRRTAWIMVTEGEALEILNATPPIQTVPSLYLANTLREAVKFGKLPKEHLGKVWIDFSDEGVDAIIPLVKPMGDHILVDGLVYFKDYQMVGTLTPTETGAILALQGINPAGYSNVIVPGDKKGVYLVKPFKRISKISVEIQDGKPKVFIDVKVEGFVEEQLYTNDLSKEKLQELEKSATELGGKVLNSLVKKLQQDESDILAIGARVRAYHPKYWEENVKTEDAWREIYKEMDIQVKMDYKILRVGMEWK